MDDGKFADWMARMLIGLMMLIAFIALKTAYGLAVKLTLWAMIKLKQAYPQLDSSLMVCTSVVGWGVIWLTLMPWLQSAGMVESEAFWLLLIGGLIWGLAIGNQIEDEVALIQVAPPSPFTPVVDLPPEFYQIDPTPATYQPPH